MKKITVIGNITRDAEIHAVGDNRSVINFGLAVNDKRKNQNGGYDNYPMFFKVALWKDNGHTSIAQHLKKGVRVFVEGIPEVEAWVDREGKASGQIKIVSRQDVEIVYSPAFENNGGNSSGNNSNNNNQQSDVASAIAQSSKGKKDDLPF